MSAVGDSTPSDSERSQYPTALGRAHETFRRWFGVGFDLDSLHAMLATTAVERMDGDPVWLLIVSGAGNAKTETVSALTGAGGIVVSTIASEGALLSATAKRERSKDATGGLLREIGDRGVLIVKDVTSILSMNREVRAQVLGALREVYDGQWVRRVGVDGGRVLDWQGRLALVGAVTTAWDSHHAVVAEMGDRFVLVRVDANQRRLESGLQAIRNTGHEKVMRAELAAAVGSVLEAADVTTPAPHDADDDGAVHAILAAADLVTRARTAVETDGRGEIVMAHAPEVPTRFAKQLAQVMRGAMAIGLPHAEGLALAIRCARDSMPPVRLRVLDALAVEPWLTAWEVCKRVNLPRTTVDRQMQALHMLGVLDRRDERVVGANGESTRWTYRLDAHVDPRALERPGKSVQGHTCKVESSEDASPRGATDIAGRYPNTDGQAA